MNNVSTKTLKKSFLSALYAGDKEKLKSFLLLKELDPTFDENQVLYTSLFNFDFDSFKLLVLSKRFNLIINDNDLFFNCLFYYYEGRKEFLNLLLQQDSVIKAIDVGKLKEVPKIQKIVKSKQIRLTQKVFENF